jgi:hypothetical protein
MGTFFVWAFEECFFAGEDIVEKGRSLIFFINSKKMKLCAKNLKISLDENKKNCIYKGTE